jgi:hypothetical protein
MKEFKDKKYFEAFINKLSEINEDNRRKLANGEIQPRNLDTFKYTWFVRDIKILIAKYSKGDNKEILKNELIGLLNIMPEYWKPHVACLKDRKGNLLNLYILDCYIYVRWLLSLSILLDVPDSEFRVLTNFLERDSINDALYDFLIASRIDGWDLSESMLLEKPKNRILEIIQINNKEDCQKNIKQYLEKEWYQTYKYFGFYNNHKKPENMWLFYGYWAFEVAAIVKIKGLDDSSFQDNKYYPHRLLY